MNKKNSCSEQEVLECLIIQRNIYGSVFDLYDDRVHFKSTLLFTHFGIMSHIHKCNGIPIMACMQYQTLNIVCILTMENFFVHENMCGKNIDIIFLNTNTILCCNS